MGAFGPTLSVLLIRLVAVVIVIDLVILTLWFVLFLIFLAPFLLTFSLQVSVMRVKNCNLTEHELQSVVDGMRQYSVGCALYRQHSTAQLSSAQVRLEITPLSELLLPQ